MRSWNLGSGTETAKFLMWLVHYFCSRWCPWTAAARDVSPADRPCSPLCWGAPLYVHTPHAGQHAQSYVDSSGARFRNCQDGGCGGCCRFWGLGFGGLLTYSTTAQAVCRVNAAPMGNCPCFWGWGSGCFCPVSVNRLTSRLTDPEPPATALRTGGYGGRKWRFCV